jgi:hypothetical protein
MRYAFFAILVFACFYFLALGINTIFKNQDKWPWLKKFNQRFQNYGKKEEDVLDKLERLKKLRDEGDITDEEYEILKKRLY